MRQAKRNKSPHLLRIRRYSIILAAVWTSIIAGSMYLTREDHLHYAELIGRIQAQAFFQKDLLFRRWAARHGGVYVPATEATPPSPYLSHIPERDIVTPSGRHLTLMNPAYMTRQLYEMSQESQQLGRGHITSLNPIRPENAADAWERKALEAFKSGSIEFSQILEVEGKPEYRYMSRLLADKACLKCHASQGYREGDIRGGISVSVPLAPIYAVMDKAMQGVYIKHSIIWIIGCGLIFFGSRRLGQVTEDLAGEEQKYRTLFEQAAVGVAQMAAPSGAFLKTNQRCSEIFGFDQEEMETLTLGDILSPEDLDAGLERMQALVEGRTQTFSIEIRCQRKDKGIIWVLLTVSPMLRTDDTSAAYIAVAQDITDRKKAEEKLQDQTLLLEQEVAERQIAQETLQEQAIFLEEEILERRQAVEAMRLSEEKFFKSFQNAPLIMTITKVEDGTYLDVNERFIELSGFSREEAIGRTSLDLGWIKAEDRHTLMHEVRLKGRVSGMELQVKPKEKKPLTCQFFVELITVSGTECLLAIAQDITEFRQMEEQLQQSMKMESIGRLAGGVAHDFNNKLTVILGYAEISMLATSKEGQLHQYLGEIIRAAEHSRNITRQLLAFSRQQVISPRPLDLNLILEDTKKTLSRLIGEDILLTFNPGENLWIANIDPSQVDQIIMNLAVNARDAMPTGGTITITTANTVIEEAYCREHLEAKPGEYVQLTVGDSGTGMEQETLQHIFEPFFTTKEAGKGTGLGLATVYGIIKQNNGFINVYSEVGYGTVFKIFLPRFVQQVIPETREAEVNPEGTGTVLLVEDDEPVRRMTTAMLETAGYTVISAAGPEAALDICGDSSVTIDLILTDVIMPGMSGKEMIDHALRLRPEVKVLYMSGYTADVIAQRGIMDIGIQFVQKPFSVKTLDAAIKKIA